MQTISAKLIKNMIEEAREELNMKKIYRATYGVANEDPNIKDFDNFKDAYKYIAVYNDEEYFKECFPIDEIEEYLEKNEYYEFHEGDNIEIIYKKGKM